MRGSLPKCTSHGILIQANQLPFVLIRGKISFTINYFDYFSQNKFQKVILKKGENPHFP